MRNKAHQRKWTALCCLLTSTGLNAFALDPADFLLFDLGPFTLRPQINLDAEYNDNIYNRETNVEADFATMISPALKVQIGQQLLDENYFSLQYTLNQIFYVEESNLNSTQHRFATDLRYSTGRSLLTGRDRVDFLSSVLGTPSVSLAGRKIDRTVVADVYRLDYRIGAKTGIYGQAEHSLTDFEQDAPLFDRQRLEGTVGFGWRYTEKTMFFGELFYGRTFLDDNALGFNPPDTRFIGGFLGVRGTFTERFTGRLKLGYESTTFSDRSPAGDAPAVDAALSYFVTERLTLDLTYLRRQEVSVQFRRSSYVSDFVSFNARQTLGSTGRLRFEAGIGYTTLHYEPALPAFFSREDTLTTANISLTYHFQTWFLSRIRYSWEQFSSSLPSTQIADYTVNRITISLAVGF